MAKTRSQSSASNDEQPGNVAERPMKRARVDPRSKPSELSDTQASPEEGTHHPSLDAQTPAGYDSTEEDEDVIGTVNEPRASDLYLDTVRTSNPEI